MFIKYIINFFFNREEVYNFKKIILNVLLKCFLYKTMIESSRRFPEFKVFQKRMNQQISRKYFEHYIQLFFLTRKYNGKF